MVFAGKKTRKSYGSLVNWDIDPRSMEWMASGVAFNPGTGLEMLKIQQETYRFLVRCCQILMQDLSLTELTSASISVAPAPPPISLDDSQFLSVQAMAAEGAYRVPSHLDFKRLHSIISANVSRAEDHIWSLREDPGYFLDFLIEESEHRPESVLDTSGNPHPEVHTPVIFWDRVAGSVVVDAYEMYIVDHLIHDVVLELVSLKEKYAGKISPDQRLPKDYERAFQLLKFFLDKSIAGPCQALARGAPSSPPLRSMFARLPAVPGEKVHMSYQRDSFDTKNDPLLWLLSALWDKTLVDVYGLSNLTEVRISDNLGQYSGD